MGAIIALKFADDGPPVNMIVGVEAGSEKSAVMVKLCRFDFSYFDITLSASL